MGKRNFRTPAQKVVRHKKLFENQSLRYLKLIEKFPTSPNVKTWEKLAVSFSNK